MVDGWGWRRSVHKCLLAAVSARVAWASTHAMRACTDGAKRPSKDQDSSGLQASASCPSDLASFTQESKLEKEGKKRTGKGPVTCAFQEPFLAKLLQAKALLKRRAMPKGWTTSGGVAFNTDVAGEMQPPGWVLRCRSHFKLCSSGALLKARCGGGLLVPPRADLILAHCLASAKSSMAGLNDGTSRRAFGSRS